MFVFEAESQKAFELIQRGSSVRFVGRRLSGRSTLLGTVTSLLESVAVPVTGVRGDLAAQATPGYGLEQIRADLGFSLKSRDTFSAVEALAGALGPNWVLTVDDPHLLDTFSLHVIAAVRQRLKLRLVVSAVAGRTCEEDLPAVWPESLVRVPDLDLPTTGALLHEVLGGAIDPHLTARFYGKSGGIAGLLTALADSARSEGLLEQVHGVWRARAASLWSPSITILIDSMLAELSDSMAEMVTWLAETGPTDSDQMHERFGRTRVREGIQHGFVSPVGAATSNRLQAWPPIVGTRFQMESHSPESTRPAVRPSQLDEQYPGASIAGAGTELTQLARSFAEHDTRETEQARRAWGIAATPENALRYLLIALGNDEERQTVRRVFLETPTLILDPVESDFRLLFQYIQWLVFEMNDPEQARNRLAEVERATPHALVPAQALLPALLVFRGEAMPSGYPEQQTPPSGTIHLTRLLLAVLSGDISTAEEELRSGDLFPQFAWQREFIEAALAYLNGAVSKSIELALRYREQATQRFDRTSFTALSYVAALASQHLGNVELTRRLILETTVIGRPHLAFGSVYSAMFVMGAMDAHFAGREQNREDMLLEAATVAPIVGPLLGMGLDFPNAIVDSGADSEKFDRDMSQAVDARLDKGYIVGAIQTGLSALTISWGPRTAGALARAAHRVDLPVFRNATELSSLLKSTDLGPLAEWSRTVHVGDDQDLIVRLLGSASRHAKAAGDDARSAALLELTREYFGPSHDEGAIPALRAPSPGETVTQREHEIGLLAGQLSNPAIAARLGISRRTVENHIAGALRKTGKTNRKELASYLASH
ncbi:LuxR C-terminal-related transcriptional regulator [Leucobacter sp. 7(1)]|uniref:helix-turn-helix transcriptional regulator n=1 Tax=Leucobacter sp. 7(1) TaxID=1255613 RepID=UPI0015956DB1|nr:LuxR C-terminal-related transcriptional regulator [Leucobacter sp. 7(1)]